MASCQELDGPPSRSDHTAVTPANVSSVGRQSCRTVAAVSRIYSAFSLRESLPDKRAQCSAVKKSAVWCSPGSVFADLFPRPASLAPWSAAALVADIFHPERRRRPAYPGTPQRPADLRAPAALQAEKSAQMPKASLCHPGRPRPRGGTVARLADKPRPLRRAMQKLKSLNQQLRENKREPEAAAEEKSEQKANTSFLLWGHRKAYVGLYIYIYIYF